MAWNHLGNLPDCKTYDEMMCMVEQVDNGGYYNPKFEADYGRCLRPAHSLVFKSKFIMSRPSKKNTNEILIWFKYSTDQLEVKEEVPILGFTTFVGSIGGSLGLFLGFGQRC